MKCEICNKHQIDYKDYRFIDGYFNGKTFVCKWCFNLNDVAIVEVFDNSINPKKYYKESK